MLRIKTVYILLILTNKYVMIFVTENYFFGGVGPKFVPDIQRHAEI